MRNQIFLILSMPLVLLSSNNNMSLKLKKKRSLASHVPPLFISGVIHPFLMVVLLQHSDELPALDPSLTKVYVPCLAFWCLCINVKLPPTCEQHCNVNFIGFISFFVKVLFCFPLYCVFSPIDCDDMYLPHSSSPLPLFFQCVLISNVCGFADGFMKKRTKKRKR